MRFTRIATLLLGITALAAILPGQTPKSGKPNWFAYVGTYTRQKSKGIYVYHYDPATGKLTDGALAAESSNPSFLAVSPNQKYVYAANENNNGMVSAYAIDPATGTLKLLNSVSSKGSGPCHVSTDKTGKLVFVANYNDGAAAAYPVKADGSLGDAVWNIKDSGSSVDKQRQSGPHAHSANISPDNKFMLLNDLGLDEVLVFKIDPVKATVTPNDPPFGKVPPGSGPRHLAFSANGKYAYVINEMSATVTAFRWDAAHGKLDDIQNISTMAAGYTGPKSTAEIFVHPNGKFLYASNRGNSTIALFDIDAATGKLTFVDTFPIQGKTPRNFAIAPDGKFLLAAGQDSDTIAGFAIDAKTGRLAPTGQSVEVGAPVCIVFARAQ
ncbi:MAG TPA: lactonase family protein [Candidatus Sulfopaludibacter sp.]|jgi:6-phosphogluconolactonase|nr:lactonase family protein [Candidatus Sulfopaludibacter sp.]